jgi:hypothetical protein
MSSIGKVSAFLLLSDFLDTLGLGLVSKTFRWGSRCSGGILHVGI